MARVLIADDEAKLGQLLREALETDGHQVTTVRGGRAALVELKARAFDVVLTDLRMPEVGGLEVLLAAQASSRPPAVMVMTAFGSAESAVAAMKAGAVDYLVKPFALDELKLKVRRLAEARSDAVVKTGLVSRLTPSLEAASPGMQAVVDAARRAAATETTILLTGESGTGKSELARYIHFHSRRAAGPLAEVHCAALPETLLERELFGHAKGAFTGADRDSPGHLAGADGGTLFLDEIGEVTKSTQVKLLRFLQHRELVPLGSTEARHVDVRVVAATNRDLAEAVKSGELREDFFYRLNVFSLKVPPLRERPEDTAALTERFLRERGLPGSKLTAAARAKVLALRWPGNVRQLLNSLERALILAGEDDIGPELFAEAEEGGGPVDAAAVLREGFDLDGFEAELLRAALQRSGGNKAAAARLLGITRRRLYSRLKSLGSEPPEDG